jgi:ribosome-associated protein
MTSLPPALLPEIQWRSSRAGGKGGQNVNKVETAVTLFWQPAETGAFSEEAKARLSIALAGKLSKEGLLIIRCAETRSQLENKAIALKKLTQLLTKALHVPRHRKATKPSKGAVQRRLDDKTRNAFQKAQRRYREE